MMVDASLMPTVEVRFQITPPQKSVNQQLNRDPRGVVPHLLVVSEASVFSTSHYSISTSGSLCALAANGRILSRNGCFKTCRAGRTWQQGSNPTAPHTPPLFRQPPIIQCRRAAWLCNLTSPNLISRWWCRLHLQPLIRGRQTSCLTCPSALSLASRVSHRARQARRRRGTHMEAFQNTLPRRNSQSRGAAESGTGETRCIPGGPVTPCRPS
jgi:hypothetical protein